jgi:hypothetical protein
MCNYKKLIQLTFLLTATFVVSCGNLTEVNKIKRVELAFSARKTDQILKLNSKKVIEGDFLELMISKFFYNDETDTSAYSRTISIRIPTCDSTFSYPTNNLQHDFKILKSDCRGLCADIKMEELEEGKIMGRRLYNLTWKIFIQSREMSLDTTLEFKMDKLQRTIIKK